MEATERERDRERPSKKMQERRKIKITIQKQHGCKVNFSRLEPREDKDQILDLT